jgi:DNA-binding transcriptional regulator GbsR (MarR family)
VGRAKKAPPTALEQAAVIVSEVVCELFERLGLRGALGRIWTTLYLSSEPLDAASLRSKLGISSGSLSMGLRELMELGLVQRTTPAGERRFYYRAETELWPAVTGIYRRRERGRLIELIERVKEAEALLADAEPDAGAGNLEFQREQVQHLSGLGSFAVDLLDAFMQRTRVELKAAQKWLSMSGRLGGEPLSRLRRKINAARGDK